MNLTKTTFALAGLTLLTGPWTGRLAAQDKKLDAEKAEASAITDGRPRAIAWSTLGPNNGMPFTDPFASLTYDQLTDLSYVVRVRRLIADERVDANGQDAKEAAALARELKQQGVDIELLMTQRRHVRRIRELKVESVAMNVAAKHKDQRVTLTGFVIPTKSEDGRLTEFFLVPTIAACSHADPPPPLLVVHVATEKGIAMPGKGRAVRVTGKVNAKATSGKAGNADGPVTIHAAYAITSPEIEVASPKQKTTLASTVTK